MNILNYLDLTNKKDIIVNTYKKGQLIHNENDLCDKVSIVLEGKVKIVSYSYNGNEILYNTINKGELFGHNLIVSNKPNYKGSVIACENTKIASMGLKTFILTLSNSPLLLKEYLTVLSNEQIYLNMKVKILSFELIIDRFMYYLKINNNQIEYESITSLANILYVKRESLSRLLSKLVKDNKITIINKKITLVE